LRLDASSEAVERLRPLGAVILSLAIMSACSNAPNASSNPSSHASGSPATSQPAETGEALPANVAPTGAPTYADATLTQGAELELGQVASARAEAGFEGQLGSSGKAAFEALAAAETAAGEAILPKAAADLGLEATATGQARVAAANGAPGGNDDPPPPTAEWTGSMLSHATFTISMMTALYTNAIERSKDASQSASNSNETYTATTDGVTETARVTTNWLLTQGRGTVSGDVSISTTATATSADGTKLGELVGKASGHVEINSCPDSSGHAAGTLSLARQEEQTPTGGTGSGFARQFKGTFTLVVGDDASLTSIEAQMNMQDGSHGPASTSGDWYETVAVPATIDPNGGISIDVNKGTHYGTGTEEQIARTLNGYATAYPIIVELAKEAQKFWRSGACVELQVNPDSKTVNPDEKVSLTVEARHKFDGSQVPGKITAKFSGKASLEPQGTPVEAPATFTFTAGRDQGDTGTITLEQKSRRGIGKKTVEYKVEGIDQATISISGSLIYHSPYFFRELHTEMVAPATLKRQSDGKLRGTATFHTTFFNEYVNGCRVEAAGDVPVDIWIWPDGLGDPDFLLSVDIDWTKAPKVPIGGSDCQYSGDLAGEYGSWEVGIRVTAKLDGGPHNEKMDVPSASYTSTTTISR
jgi:hypothetical protein